MDEIDQLLEARKQRFIADRAARLQRQQATPPPMPQQAPPMPQQAPGDPGAIPQALSTAIPAMGPALHAGRGLVKGFAGIADSAINAGRGIYGMATGEDMGPRQTPATDFATKHLPDLSGVNQTPGLNRAAEVAGEFAAPAVVGQGAVNAVGKGMAMLKPAASASSRLGTHMNAAREYLANISPIFQRYGAGQAVNGAKVGMPARAAIGAAAGATGAAAVAPDEPRAIGLGAGIGGVLGPASHAIGTYGTDIKEGVSRAMSKARVPELRDEAVRNVVGPRAGQVLNTIQNQAPNRITPGLPIQVADDPGLSSLHRYVQGQNPSLATGTTDFMRQQAVDLADKLKSRTAGYSADIAARKAATDSAYKALSKSTDPISAKIPRDWYNATAATNPASNAFKTVKREAKPLLQSTASLNRNPVVPANVMHDVKKNITEKLKADYTIKGSPLTDSQKKLLGELSDSIDAAFRRSRRPAARLYQSANDTFKRMSEPVNQKAEFGRLFSDSVEGATAGAGMRETLRPTTLANKIAEMQQPENAKVWGLFNREQQKFLTQLRHEAPLNANALGLGAGSAAEDVAKTAVPEGLFTMTRPLPGVLGRGVSSAVRLAAGKQIGRINDELEKLLSTPQGIQTIEQILQGLNRPRPVSTGNVSGALLGAGIGNAANQFN